MRNFAALDDQFDVVIVGGGASGLGAAVDAVSRGYKTALVEAVDFAKATSSRSTKLIHGGVRYLAEGEIGLVREALRERGALRRNAPHLVSDLGFICPAYKWYEVPYYFVGLSAYDVLAGNATFGRSRYLSARQTLERAPAMRRDGLRGAVRYHDGQFDDARLAVALARTAIERGAVIVNYARAVAFERRGARITGVRVADQEHGGELSVRAKVVVNATGIYSDVMRQMDDPAARPILSMSRGSHVVVARDRFPGDDAMIVPRTDDGRVIFVIPWHGHAIIGTTDIAEPGPSLDPVPTAVEIDYLLEHASRYLEEPVRRSHVTAAFCGVRPLVNSAPATTAKLSREHLIETSASGLVSVAGGKWTTYRKMAEDTIDVAREVAGLPAAPSRTADLPLHGSDGSDRRELQALIREEPVLAQPIHPALPYSQAEIVYAARKELARTVDDALSRRTRAFFVDVAASVAAAPLAGALLARELGRSQEWSQQSAAAYMAIAKPVLALL